VNNDKEVWNDSMVMYGPEYMKLNKNYESIFTVPDAVTQTKLPELRAYDNIGDGVSSLP
jgi:hypothetical protein